MSKFGTYQLPRENFAAAAITRIEALMVQEHWVFVKEVILSGNVFRVWKSPGEFNSAGRDFYMSFYRLNSITASYIGFRIFLGFDKATNNMTGYAIDSAWYLTNPLSSPTWRPSELNSPVLLDSTYGSVALHSSYSLNIVSSDLLWTRVTPDFVHAFVGSSPNILVGGLYTPAADYSEWLTSRNIRQDFIPLCYGIYNTGYSPNLYFGFASVGNPTFDWRASQGAQVARIGGTPSDITQPGKLSRYPLASLVALRQKDSVTGAFVDIGYLPGIAQVYAPITVGRGDKVDITIGTVVETYVVATEGTAGYKPVMSIGYLED